MDFFLKLRRAGLLKYLLKYLGVCSRRLLNAELQQITYNYQITRGVGRPVVFQIELTNNCPMTCQMCPRTHSMTRPVGYMSVDVYTRVLREASLTTSDVFLHHFGDSLLHPDLGSFIAAAGQYNIRTHLSANPILLNKSRIEAIVDNGLHELVLSLDGVTSETSARVRGVAARNVKLATQRIRELVEYRQATGKDYPRIVLQIVEQRQNVHEIDEWLASWDGTPGIDRVKVKRYITWSGSEDAVNALRVRPHGLSPSIVCERPWTSVTVLWDGRVVPCCFDHDGLLELGRLSQSTLTDIWRGETLRRLREHHKNNDLDDIPLCRNCVDKEGYPTKKLFYPLNRVRDSITPLADEVRSSGQSNQSE